MLKEMWKEGGKQKVGEQGANYRCKVLESLGGQEVFGSRE